MRFGEGPQVRALQREDCKFDIILHERAASLHTYHTTRVPHRLLVSCRQRLLAYSSLATILSLSLSALDLSIPRSNPLCCVWCVMNGE